jgi:hypothetical protein
MFFFYLLLWSWTGWAVSQVIFTKVAQYSRNSCKLRKKIIKFGPQHTDCSKTKIIESTSKEWVYVAKNIVKFPRSNKALQRRALITYE